MENAQNLAKVPKFKRTTQEQLQHFLQFVKAHPELQAGKNNPHAPRAVQTLWSQLGEQLNSLRGPTRTAAKWRESLSQWKKQLRCRARQSKVQAMITGGGPRTPDVTEFEAQALQIFGATAVDGLPGIVTLGVQMPAREEGVTPHANSSSPEDNTPSTSSPVEIPLSPPPEQLSPMAVSPPPPVEEQPPATTPNRKISLETLFRATMESIKVREEREERALAQQAQLISVLGQMSQSLLAMNQTLEKLNEKLSN